MDRTNLRQVLSELNDEYESLSNQDVVAVDVESIMSSGVNSGGPNYERIKIYEYNSATNEYSIPAGGHTGSEMNKFRSFMNRNGSGYATISIRP